MKTFHFKPLWLEKRLLQTREKRNKIQIVKMSLPIRVISLSKNLFKLKNKNNYLLLQLHLKVWKNLYIPLFNKISLFKRKKKLQNLRKLSQVKKKLNKKKKLKKSKKSLNSKKKIKFKKKNWEKLKNNYRKKIKKKLKLWCKSNKKSRKLSLKVKKNMMMRNLEKMKVTIMSLIHLTIILWSNKKLNKERWNIFQKVINNQFFSKTNISRQSITRQRPIIKLKLKNKNLKVQLRKIIKLLRIHQKKY